MRVSTLLVAAALIECALASETRADSCDRMKNQVAVVFGTIEGRSTMDGEHWKLSVDTRPVVPNCKVVEIYPKDGKIPGDCKKGMMFFARGRISTDVIAAAEANLGYDSAALRNVEGITCLP